jgi:L-lactate dehydrogenase (cytochrome)
MCPVRTKLLDRYPSIEDLRRRARHRIPFFAWEYLDSGTGRDDGAKRNTDAMRQVTLTPRFMRGSMDDVDTGTELFGRRYAAPFGVAPVGLTGLMWPEAENVLARAAAKFRIPYSLSTVATQSPETIGPLTDGMGWFQLYPPRDPGVRRDLLARVKAAGFTTLLVTADVPTGSTRERQRRAGVTVPPKMTPLMIYRCMVRPQWSLATLRAGSPSFKGVAKYASGADLQNMTAFIGTGLGGTLDWKYLEELRNEWDGPIVIKGIMSVADTRDALSFGADGIGVSNHGARQCDGTPAAVEVLPRIAEVVDGRASIIFDSGIRTGLDICRVLALGADFVLCGRAFMYGVAALGERGGEHVANMLMTDLRNNMVQLGSRNISDLRDTRGDVGQPVLAQPVVGQPCPAQ